MTVEPEVFDIDFAQPRSFEDSLQRLQEQWRVETADIEAIFVQEMAALQREHEASMAVLSTRRRDRILARQRELEELIDRMLIDRRRRHASPPEMAWWASSWFRPGGDGAR